MSTETRTLPRVRTSGIPGSQTPKPQLRHKNSKLAMTPTSNRNSTTPTTGPPKSPRRAVSIAAFNNTKGTRISSLPPSPLSAVRRSRDSLFSDDGDGPPRPGKPPKRLSAFPGPPEDPSGLLLPSPPPSRGSSAMGSYPTMGGDDDDRLGGGGKEDKGNVVVSVRVRPDGDDGIPPEWVINGRDSKLTYHGREGGEYSYDNVFTPDDDNARVYDSCAKRLVRRVMQGYHGTVFAYGMTGTGKTFSMQGTTSSPGVIPLAVTDIFSFIRETPHREFLLRVSYLEIYNERINDLLSPPTQGDEIKLREDPKRGVYATPLKEEIVQSPTQLLRVIAKGDLARRVGSTQFNQRSSRSHAVVQIVVESRERLPGVSNSSTTMVTAKSGAGGVRVSTLSLIDLAGSERAAENKERRQEGAHINKSLLTLGNVISKLADIRSGKGGVEHLPYRDSKLTRLLQPALSGNSLVSILCTISTCPSGGLAAANGSSLGETLNTLQFAARARNSIVSRAKKADESALMDAGSRALLDRYRMEIQELRVELEKQKAAATAQDEIALLVERVESEKMAQERHSEQLLEMQLARTALKERIDHLNRLILCSKSVGVNHGTDGHRNSMASSLFQVALGGKKERPFSTSTSISSASSSMLDVTAEGDPQNASVPSQVRALQADLADRNRYIATLEKRLLHARRSSHSRVSMGIAAGSPIRSPGSSIDSNPFFPETNPIIINGQDVESLLREKDDEILSLRAMLEDKERMVAALRSSVRKRDVAESHRYSTDSQIFNQVLQFPTPPTTITSPTIGAPTTPSLSSSSSSVTPTKPRSKSLEEGGLSPIPSSENLTLSLPKINLIKTQTRASVAHTIGLGIDTSGDLESTSTDVPQSAGANEGKTRRDRRDGLLAITRGEPLGEPPKLPLPPTPPVHARNRRVSYMLESSSSS